MNLMGVGPEEGHKNDQPMGTGWFGFFYLTFLIVTVCIAKEMDAAYLYLNGMDWFI